MVEELLLAYIELQRTAHAETADLALDPDGGTPLVQTSQERRGTAQNGTDRLLIGGARTRGPLELRWDVALSCRPLDGHTEGIARLVITRGAGPSNAALLAGRFSLSNGRPGTPAGGTWTLVLNDRRDGEPFERRAFLQFLRATIPAGDGTAHAALTAKLITHLPKSEFAVSRAEADLAARLIARLFAQAPLG